MAKCPSCGDENPSSVKSWPMISKPSKSGEMLKQTIIMYKCFNCGKSFRTAEEKEKITMKGIIEKSKLLEEKLMEATKKRAELEERVKELEKEKTHLYAEVEALKVIPALEEKASSLESAILKLREEKEALLKNKDPNAEGTSNIKEKPIDSYVAEPAPEVQSSEVKTLIAEPETVVTTVETIPMITDDVAVTMIPCEAVLAEEPIIKEKIVENLVTEPVLAELSVGAATPEAIPVEAASAEIAAPEVELTSIEEPSKVEPMPAEPDMIEPPVEISMSKEEIIEAQVDTLTSIIVEPETSTTEKTVEAPANEDVLSEDKPIETLLKETNSEATVDAQPDMKLDEAKMNEPPTSEISTIITPPSENTVEVTASADNPIETPALEVTPSEAQQTMEEDEAPPRASSTPSSERQENQFDIQL